MNNLIATVRAAYQNWQADRNAKSAYQQGVNEFREDGNILDYEMDGGILPGMEVTGEVDEVTADVENGVIYVPEAERGAVTPEAMETAVEEYVLGVFEQAGQPIVDGVARRYAHVANGVEVDLGFSSNGGEGDVDVTLSRNRVDRLPHGDTGMDSLLEKRIRRQAVEAVQNKSGTPFDELRDRYDKVSQSLIDWGCFYPPNKAYAFAAPHFEEARQGSSLLWQYNEMVEEAEGAGLDGLGGFMEDNWRCDESMTTPITQSIPLNPEMLGLAASLTLNQALSDKHGQDYADHLTREWAIRGTVGGDAPDEFRNMGPFKSQEDLPTAKELAAAIEDAFDWAKGQDPIKLDPNLIEKAREWR